MTELDIVLAVLALLAFAGWLAWRLCTQVAIVWEHEHALLYKHGKLVGRLEAGKHRFWGRGHDLVRVDSRWKEAVIQGQEFLTADRVPLKVSGLARYRVADPEKHAAASVDAAATLYGAVQIALRDVIGSKEIDEVLEMKASFGEALHGLVAPAAAELGYELDAVVVRDLMLSGDLKRLFTQAMTAKQEALAGLEKARGEAAAIRVMANAARAFEHNPALLQLRFLQMLEQNENYNNQLVVGPLDPLMSFLRK